jgi:alanine racemase
VVAIVDLDVIAANVKALKDLIGPDCRLLTVVKANAYGFASVPIAHAAIEAGAEALGVACVDEGIELRRAGITDTPILVFGAIGQHERARAITNRLSIVVTNAGLPVVWPPQPRNRCGRSRCRSTSRSTLACAGSGRHRTRWWNWRARSRPCRNCAGTES